jgi:ribosomal protein S18 acetylase RimI-like enzyme
VPHADPAARRSPAAVVVRALGPDDLASAEALVAATLAGRHQARLGATVDVLALPGLGAWAGDRLVGLATWSPPGAGRRSELAALAVAGDHRGRGVGAALVEAAAEAARAAGAVAQWLVTTNDNLDALRLYQRHGYRLTALRPGALDVARASKPSIPRLGRDGIPLRDELVLQRDL